MNTIVDMAIAQRIQENKYHKKQVQAKHKKITWYNSG